MVCFKKCLPEFLHVFILRNLGHLYMQIIQLNSDSLLVRNYWPETQKTVNQYHWTHIILYPVFNYCLFFSGTCINLLFATTGSVLKKTLTGRSCSAPTVKRFIVIKHFCSFWVCNHSWQYKCWAIASCDESQFSYIWFKWL